jgi:hypothetical protein
LNLESLPAGQRVVIHNNTLVNVRTWLGLVQSSTDRPGVTVANNLILRSEGVKGTPDRLRAAAESWRFQSNWWEPAPVTEEPLDLQTALVTIHEGIDILHREDRDHPDFLRPPPDSPLFSAGWSDGGLRPYVGALGPNEPD